MIEPLKSDIIDSMIVVSEANIEIIEENCTEIIVNFYNPEMDVSEHDTFNE